MITYLQSKGVTVNMVGREYRANCMFCDDTKGHLYINQEKKVFFCHKCGSAGNIWKLKRHYGETPEVKTFDQSFKIPEKGKDIILQTKLAGSEQAIQFLMAERGFRKDTIAHFKLGFTDEMISIPYYENDILVNFKYRKIASKEWAREKDCKSTLYNMDSIDKTKDIIITEGEFDCVAAWQYGLRNTVSVSIGANSIGDEWVDFFDSCSGNIYIAYDNDKTGNEGADKIAKRIGFERCYRVKLPLKDMNDCLMSGLTKEDIDRCIVNAKQYCFDKILHVTKIMERVDALFRKEDKGCGLKLKGWDDLNERLGGIRDSELTVLTGETASGKTTVALNLFYDLMNAGKNVLILSSEMPPEKIMTKMFSIHSGIPFHELKESEYVDAVKHFSNKKMFFVDVHGRVTIQELSEYIEYCKRKYDVDFILIDHLHFMIDPYSERQVQEIDGFMKTLVGLSLKHKIHVLLIAHPAKLDNTDGRVSMNDLRGASSIKQDAHNVIIVWRDRKKEECGVNQVVIDCQKVRDPSGKGGSKRYDFCPMTQRYKEAVNVDGAKEREVPGVQEKRFQGKRQNNKFNYKRNW